MCFPFSIVVLAYRNGLILIFRQNPYATVAKVVLGITVKELIPDVVITVFPPPEVASLDFLFIEIESKRFHRLQGQVEPVRGVGQRMSIRCNPVFYQEAEMRTATL